MRRPQPTGPDNDNNNQLGKGQNRAMNAFVSAWAQGVIRFRLAVLSITALLVLVFINTGPDIPFDNATERYFIEGDPTLEDYRVLLELYGDIEYLVVGFEAAPGETDVFNTDTLAAMGRRI